jgi:tetratricopeptide (TPR) repeat protein
LSASPCPAAGGGDRRGLANTWDSLGYAHHHLGNHEQATICYQRALDLLGELGDRYCEAQTLNRLGDTREIAHDLNGARLAWQHAVDILDQLGYPGDHFYPSAEKIRAKLRDLDETLQTDRSKDFGGQARY